MKVLVLVHSLAGGGAERVTATLANRWAEMGWEVTVVTMAPRDQDAYRLLRTVTRIVLNLANESRSLVAKIVRNWQRIRALRRILQQERPDIALAMMSTSNVLLALASVGLKRTACIGSERVHPPQVPLGAAWEWLRARAYILLDATVVVANESREWMYAHTSARRVVVIPNAVTWPLADQDPIRAPESVGGPERKRLLSVGRLVPQKGYDRLIEVFGRLASRFPDWELVIVGDGAERDNLKRRIDALGLQEVVLLPGHAGNIGDWYRQADLYVLSSRFEGFPNALAEAMAHGLPAVSVDCDTGPRDIIRHEVDGLLVASGDEDTLEAALGNLMADATKRAELGSRAADVRTRFSLDRVNEMWLDLFRELVA